MKESSKYEIISVCESVITACFKAYVHWQSMCDTLRRRRPVQHRKASLWVRLGPSGHFFTLGSLSSSGWPPDPRTEPVLASLQSVPDKEAVHGADSSLDSPPSLCSCPLHHKLGYNSQPSHSCSHQYLSLTQTEFSPLMHNFRRNNVIYF